MKIFLSHSSRDKALVREIRSYLPHHIHTYLDENDLLVGMDLNVSIRNAIQEESDYVIIFLGRESIRSEWVKKELKWALEQEKKIGRPFVLPVLLDDVWDQVEPEEFKNRLYLKCFDRTEAGVKACADRLSDQLFGWLSQRLKEAQTRTTLDQRFAELQSPTPEQARSLQAEIARLGEALRRQSEHAREVFREPIPIPLPALRGTFVDRETELDTLHHLLRQSDMRLVVIVAPGGYGKTELTTKILKGVAPSTSIIDPNVQGILYLRCLRGDLSLGRMFVEAGRIVGGSEQFQQTYASRDLTLKRKLEFFFRELSRAGDVWVVMDNFEDLLAADDTISDPELRQFIETAVDTSHTVRLIATTRAVPRFRGSQRVKPIDLRAGLPEDQAIAYLRTDGADYGLADADESLLRTFVNRVHRIPKALESVIGYLSEKYPVVQLSDLMANDALFADFDRYDAENGLKQLIAEQFSDQTPDAQLVLCALSIFPKPAPLTALRYLLPALDWATVLPRLERNRLVSRQGDRYDLHPIVREYAYARIPIREGDGSAGASPSPAEPQEFTRSALHTRLANFFRELRKPQKEWKTIADLEPQLDEFHHRVRAGQYDAAAWVLDDIDFDYLQLWGHSRTVIELREQLEGKLTDTYLAQVNVGNLGLVYEDTGRVREAIPCFERALQSARDENDQGGISAWLGNLGLAYSDLGETRKAIGYYEQALAIDREIGDRSGESYDLANLGEAYHHLVNLADAHRCYEDAFALDIPSTNYSCAVMLGVLCLEEGKAKGAQDYFARGIALCRALLEKTPNLYDALYELTLAQLGSGQPDDALATYRQALGVCAAKGTVQNALQDLRLLGRAAQPVGGLAEAAALLEGAIEGG